MTDVGLLHVSPQPFPVLRLVFRANEVVGEMVQVPDVPFERPGAPYRQIPVVPIGAFGRGVALEPHRDDGYVLVVAHGINGGLDFAELGRIAPIPPINHGLVYREVDEGRSRQRTGFS